MTRHPIDPEMIARNDGWDEGFEFGLAEAKRRLSRAGMHDGKCPEPDKPCTCGIEKAIDRPVKRAWNEPVIEP